MIGAIIGDIVGSVYEFANTRDYNFPLFGPYNEPTDDTVCTLAVADAILLRMPYKDSLVNWCKFYPQPMGGYGASFAGWIHHPVPYDSFGNGAAMRVSPTGWAFSPEDCEEEARKSAECSHSHPEGIKGAQTIAKAVALLRTGSDKEAVKGLCVERYGKDYKKHLPRRGVWDETCQGCVPLAIDIFLRSGSFEDAIRQAVAYGGDSDTLAAIVGSIAGAYFPIPLWIRNEALKRLPPPMKSTLLAFERRYKIYDDRRTD